MAGEDHRAGDVPASFVPPEAIRRLRDLTRYAEHLIRTGPRRCSGWKSCWRTPRSSCPRWPLHIRVSGRAMIAALMAGERDPGAGGPGPAADAPKIPVLQEALTGQFTSITRS